MVAAMQSQIVDALGSPGITNIVQPEKAAKVLILQIGDNEEFRALIEDFALAPSTQNSSAALNHDYSQHFALAQTQSNDVRLAHVGNGFDFPPEAIKGAYGNEYTGNFHHTAKKKTA
jgi:hypothetical protein